MRTRSGSVGLDLIRNPHLNLKWNMDLNLKQTGLRWQGMVRANDSRTERILRAADRHDFGLRTVMAASCCGSPEYVPARDMNVCIVRS